MDFSNFDTGDILLFSGSGFWFSYVVEYFTWSDFSHVGMILKDPTYIDPSLEGYFMLESGVESFPDAVDHRLHFGVQIVNLEKVFQNYDGRIYHRKLNITPEIRDIIPDVLQSTWKTIRDLPYDDHIWDLFRTEFGVKCGNLKRTDAFFCSALQTFIYERFDIFTVDLDWDMIEPKDYDDNGRIHDFLKDGITFSVKKCVKY